MLSTTCKCPQCLVYIFHRCTVDTKTTILSQGTHETRFYFTVFEFGANHENVYVTCNATFCTASDYSPECLQTCNRKRDGTVLSKVVAEDSAHPGSEKDWFEVISLPIHIQQKPTLNKRKGMLYVYHTSCDYHIP